MTRRNSSRAGRTAAVVALVACVVWTPAAPALAVPVAPSTHPSTRTPVTDHCPYRAAPAPAVDTSEAVPAGGTTPTPLPVHTPPIGGHQLGGCGVIADPSAGPVPKRLTSAGWLVADMDTGRVIAAKDPHGRYRPASTIKVLLAQVALRDLDLDQVVPPHPDDWAAEGDACGMGPGGHYTVRDLITGLLVVSGNDCANALARELGGIPATLTKMNDRARELHADDTRATTPSGLDAAGMSTSPYDLATIFRAAMTDPTFRRIIAMPTAQFPGYPPRPDVPGDPDHPGYLMRTSDELLVNGYPGMIGGKTGYTDDALKTFVGAVDRNGHRLEIVQMYGLSTSDDDYWTQARSLIDYGYRAGTDVSVGTLSGKADSVSAASGDPASGDPASSASATPTAAAAHRETADSRHGSGWSMRLLIGLAAALVAIVALIAGLSLARRR